MHPNTHIQEYGTTGSRDTRSIRALAHSCIPVFAFLLLSACDPAPSEKVATFDPASRTLTLPAPCPDWSHTETVNYYNHVHSNYGCAVNRNLAVQVADPNDLVHGRGTGAGDAEASATALEQYRAGKLPEPLEPQQDNTGDE